MGRAWIWIAVTVALGGAAWFVLGPGDGDEGTPDLLDAPAPEVEEGPALKGGGAVAGTPAAAPARFPVRGRVVDARGDPAAGVDVVLRREGPAHDPADPSTWRRSPAEQIAAVLARTVGDPETRRPVVARTTSDDDGRFTLHAPAHAAYRLDARPAPPRWGTSQGFSLHAGKEQHDTILTVLDGTPLAGRVLDTADRPVQAVLHASFLGAVDGVQRVWSGRPASTDTEGRWRFDAVPPGTVRLAVTLADGRKLAGLLVTTPRESPFVVRVPAAEASITGRVTDGAGVPVAGAHVVLHLRGAAAAEGVPGTATLVARSGADGRYAAAQAPAGGVTLVEAVAEGFLPYQQRSPRGTPPLATVPATGTVTVDVVLVRGGRVEGRVTELEGGAPIPGATVTLMARQGSAAGAGALPPATTDADGRYRIDGVQPGTWLALPSADGHYLPQLRQGPQQQVPMAPGGPGTASPPELTVVITADGRTVTRDLALGRAPPVEGLVRGPGGAPVAGAEIRARGFGLAQVSWAWGLGGQQAEALATSDADGRFTVTSLPPGDRWVLFARKAGHAGVYADGIALPRPPDAKPLVLELVAGATLRGRVEGLTPGADARVGCWGPSQELAARSQNHPVEPDGRFEITGVPPGSWTLNLWAGGTPGTQLRVADVKPGEVREDLVLTLREGGTVEGVVLDSDGDPVPELSLALNVRGGGSWVHARTDADGQFVFRQVMEGTAQAYVWDPTGRQVALGGSLEVPATDVRLTYDPPPVVVLRGEVRARDGSAIAVCRVGASATQRAARPRGFPAPVPVGPGQNSVEALAGRFEVTATGEGPWTVTASDARDERGRALNLRSGQTTVEDAEGPVVVWLETGGVVEGRVLDETGGPLEGVRVQAGARGDTTDTQGRFRIEGLESARVAVQVTPPTGYVRPRAIATDPGRTDLEFRLVKGLTIRGRALGPDGEPLPQGYASGTWQEQGPTPAGSTGAQLGKDGRFELPGIPPDVRVRVQVQTWSASGSAAFAPAVVEGVEPGTDDLELRLGGGLSVEGRVLDADGKPPSNVFVYARTVEGNNQTGWVQVDETGRFRLGGLKPEAYDVHVMRQGGGAAPPPTRVTPPAGALEIRLPRTGSLKGRIAGLAEGAGAGWQVRARTPAGQRVAGARVNPDGTFDIPAVPAGEDLVLEATRRGDERYARRRGVRAGPGEVVLRLEIGASIAGRVEGAVVDGRVVAMVWAEGEDGFMGSGTIDEDGRFTIHGLPSGAYTLKARTYGAQSKQAERAGVGTGSTDVVLTLR